MMTYRKAWIFAACLLAALSSVQAAIEESPKERSPSMTILTDKLNKLILGN